ncbi:MAG: DUF359 domain-containing protein [Candidatus Lokiarchaeota archaeon]|nr:DUF359 domain-containing protein [Candidatus Lokiarchaeota archaeon]
MSDNLKIKSDQRQKYSQPLGDLISGSRVETIPKVIEILKNVDSEIQIYLVGDIVTKDFLNNQFLKEKVQISIIDEKTKRESIKADFEDFFDEIIEFENPEGTINPDSIDLLKKIAETEKRTLLKITRGEEDLLVLPLTLVLPLSKTSKRFIFYGQPPITDRKPSLPEGIVMVELNRHVKKLVARIITLMQNK